MIKECFMVEDGQHPWRRKDDRFTRGIVTRPSQASQSLPKALRCCLFIWVGCTVLVVLDKVLAEKQTSGPVRTYSLGRGTRFDSQGSRLTTGGSAFSPNSLSITGGRSIWDIELVTDSLTPSSDLKSHVSTTVNQKGRDRYPRHFLEGCCIFKGGKSLLLH